MANFIIGKFYVMPDVVPLTNAITLTIAFNMLTYDTPRRCIEMLFGWKRADRN